MPVKWLNTIYYFLVRIVLKVSNRSTGYKNRDYGKGTHFFMNNYLCEVFVHMDYP